MSRNLLIKFLERRFEVEKIPSLDQFQNKCEGRIHSIKIQLKHSNFETQSVSDYVLRVLNVYHWTMTTFYQRNKK